MIKAVFFSMIIISLYGGNIFYAEGKCATESCGLEQSNPSPAGTVIAPIMRGPSPYPKILDPSGNAVIGPVKSGEQIQISGLLVNSWNVDQPFAYLVQIQDANGSTVSLSWISGTLTAGQAFSPAQSWTPTSPGAYTAQIFVWQSITNPNALSPPTSVGFNVV